MKMLNNVTLIGRVVGEVKTSQDSKRAEFSVAVTKDSETTYFFDIKVFDNLVNVSKEHLKKGDRVALNGYLCQYKYTTASGQNRSTIYIVANGIHLLENKPAEAKPVENKTEK